MNTIKLSDTKVGFSRWTKHCFIIDDKTVCDTQFQASIKAIDHLHNPVNETKPTQHPEEIKEVVPMEQIVVIKYNNELIAVHESEANINEHLVLKATSDSHGWREATPEEVEHSKEIIKKLLED